MLRGHAVPRAWLDVGGGHGHFCNAVIYPVIRRGPRSNAYRVLARKRP